MSRVAGRVYSDAADLARFEAIAVQLPQDARVAVDTHGALLVADDVGNAVWRVTPAAATAP